MADQVTQQELNDYTSGRLSPEEQRRIEDLLASEAPSEVPNEAPLSTMDLARQLRQEQEGIESAQMRPSGLELAGDVIGGTGAGILESLTSLAGIPAIAEAGVRAIESVPANVRSIRDFLAVATPEQRREFLSESAGQAGGLLTALVPGGQYLSERLSSESPTVKRALGLLPPATPEQAYLERTGQPLEEASALRRLYENVSTTLGAGAREAFPALKLADIVLPETGQEAEALGREIGQAVGPTAITKTAKGAARLAKAGVERLPAGIKNIGQNKAVEITNASRTKGGLIKELRVPSRTAESELPIFEDAQKFEKWMKSKNPLKDIPTDEANAPYIFERILGTEDELGNRLPDGVFRKIIDEAKISKDRILADADLQIPEGLKKTDFNFKRLDDAIEQARQSGFEAGQLTELEKAKRVFERDVSGDPFVGAKPVFTLQDSQDYLRMLDRQLTELGAFDDRIWKNLATNPSVTENLKKRVNALKSIRATVSEAQESAVKKALGEEAGKSLKSLNADIAGSIEFENLFKRLNFQTMQATTKSAGASLNKTIRESGFMPTRIMGVNKALEPITSGPVTKAALEQAEAVKAIQDISNVYQGVTPAVEPRQLEALTSYLAQKGAPMTPAQRATTAGLGYTSAVAPEDQGQAQAAELPSSLIDLLSQPQQPPMTPETPVPMAGGNQITSLLNSLATTGGEEEMKLPGTETMDQMNQLQGLDFINQMSGQPAAPMVAPEQEGMAPPMPGAPEAPFASVGGMLGQLPEMAGGAMPAEGASLMAQRQAFKPVKPTMDNVINNAGQIAQQITSLIGPQEANNVLQQLQDAIQSKNDAAVGKVVTAFTKTYPEAAQIFEDEFPDMPIFTFGGKIYQADDRAAYEKWIGDSKASSIEKAKSLSALNTDGTVRLPKGR